MARFNKFKPQTTNQDKKDNKNGSQNQKAPNADHQNKVENKIRQNNNQNKVNEQDENINAGENWKKAQQFMNETLFERASRVYQEFVKKELQKYKLAKADEAWMKKIMTDGTLKDKISAISIYIRDNPKTTLPAIENLMTFANTKSKKDVILCYNSLKGVFLESVMPKNGELKTFQQNTKGKTNIPDKDLIEFFYQHKLKELFYRYVNSLIAQLNDNLFFFRKAMLMLLIDVVIHRQECQETILGALLNKLGDSDKKIVTILNQNLGKLLFRKGELVMPLVKEIERFVFRPNIKIQSQFYAINFLNTINYAVVSDDVLKEIIKLLFILFKKMIETNEEDLLASKILSQILRGINKIFPHTKKNFEQYKQFFSEKINELYKLIHQTKSIKIRIQTLLFIFQVENQENNLTDRYYRILYEMLIDPDVTHSSQTELFFDLLYFSLKADSELGRVKSFVKRLLQHAIHCEPPFIITSLIFISKLLNAQPTIKTMIQQSERFFDDNEENFKDVEESDDGEENFKDADESKGMEEEEEEEQQQQENQQDENQNEQEGEEKGKNQQKQNYADYMGYDAFKREPRFTGCNESCLWELTNLVSHNHPTVKKFAEILLTQQKPNIEYKGNPLLDFTVANFLDRFSFKNAKKKESVGMKNLKQKGKIRMSKLESALQVDDFMKMDQRKIREEEKFFLRFFQQKQRKREGIEKRQKKKDFEDFADANEDAEMDAFADQLAEEQLDSDFYDEDEPFSMSEDQDDDNMEEDGVEGDEQYDFDDDGEDGDEADLNEDEEGEQEDDEDMEQDFDENDELQSAEIPENYVDSEEDEDEQIEDEDEEEDFDEDELGDIDDLEQDLAQDREKMGLEESDYEDDDIEDFGTLLEKAGQEDDIDDRKKFGKQVGQKASKTKVIKKEPKVEKKPRHSKEAKKQSKKGPKKAGKKQNKGGSKNKKGKGRK